MDEILSKLNLSAFVEWIAGSPWLMGALGLILAAVVIWQIKCGSLGTRRFVINVVGIGLVIWGGLWFTDWVQPSLTAETLFTPPVVGPQPVNVVFVEQKTFEKWAVYTGSTFPFERVVVNARSSGFVQKINVYPGDRIKARQVLATLETSELAPRLELAMAQLTYLRAELKRDKKLLRRRAIPASAFELSRSKERVASAKVKLLKTEIGYGTIRAQSDGWISERFLDPGQYVRMGKRILTYDRLDQVRIRFYVAESDLATIRPGSEVILEFPQIPKQRFAGTAWESRLLPEFETSAIRDKVTTVFPRLDAKSRLGVVEVLIANPDLALRSNTYVVGRLITARVEDSWTVPESALVHWPDGTIAIFIAPAFSDQGEVELREVKIGLRNGREAQVLEGLEEAAFVVTAGNRGLTDGENVMVLAREGGL